MTGSILDQGFQLMIFGVGVVFAFLTMLVILTTIMSKFVLKFLPEPVVEPAPSKGKPQSNPGDDAQVITAISAAVHKFRKNRKRK